MRIYVQLNEESSSKLPDNLELSCLDLAQLIYDKFKSIITKHKIPFREFPYLNTFRLDFGDNVIPSDVDFGGSEEPISDRVFHEIVKEFDNSVADLKTVVDNVYDKNHKLFSVYLLPTNEYEMPFVRVYGDLPVDCNSKFEEFEVLMLEVPIVRFNVRHTQSPETLTKIAEQLTKCVLTRANIFNIRYEITFHILLHKNGMGCSLAFNLDKLAIAYQLMVYAATQSLITKPPDDLPEFMTFIELSLFDAISANDHVWRIHWIQ